MTQSDFAVDEVDTDVYTLDPDITIPAQSKLGAWASNSLSAYLEPKVFDASLRTSFKDDFFIDFIDDGEDTTGNRELIVS